MESRSLYIHLYLNEDGKGGHVITRVIILAILGVRGLRGKTEKLNTYIIYNL